jgi:hypothetical protein
MARPPKAGIDYAGWDTSIFDTDDKIDALIDSQGIAGFTVYFYLCQKAYATNGYYLSWGCNQAASVSRRLGKGCSATLVQNVVEICLRVCLFDRELYESHAILTSRGIQRRYWAVKKDRSRNEMPTEYWLLGPSENEENGEGFVSHTQNGVLPPSKPSFTPPKIHESKVKESKVNTHTIARGKHSNVVLTDEQYAELASTIPSVDAYIDYFSTRMHDKGYRYEDHYKAILEWWSRDKDKWGKKKRKDIGAGSFEVQDFFARAVGHQILDYKGDTNNGT